MTGREADTNPAVLNLPWQNNVLAYSVSKDPFSLTSLGFKHSQDMVSRSFLSFTFEASLVLPVFYAWLQNNGVKLVGNSCFNVYIIYVYINMKTKKLL